MTLSSYQKLKKQNEELEKQIEMLILEPQSLQTLYFISEYKLRRNISESVWTGTLTDDSFFKGLTKQI